MTLLQCKRNLDDTAQELGKSLGCASLSVNSGMPWKTQGC